MSNDESIIKTLRESPQDGFKLLMRTYQEPVYWHIRRMVVCHDDAQDATQEAFVRIYRSLGGIESVKSLKAWIYRIATNEALRIIERRGEETLRTSIQMYADDYVNLSEKAEGLLQEAILSLPRKQQLAFTLRYYDEMSYSEIANVCETTMVSAKMNYHLAKDKIVKYIKSHQDE